MSAASRSSTRGSGMRSSAQTCSAMSRLQPANTDRRRSRICSSAVSRSKLQSTAACRVCWRGGAVRSPDASSRNLSSIRVGDLLDRQRADARRGQLDRQRHPVQHPAELHHVLAVLAGQGEARPDGGGPVDKQPDCLGFSSGVGGAAGAWPMSAADGASWCGSGRCCAAAELAMAATAVAPARPSRRERAAAPGWWPPAAAAGRRRSGRGRGPRSRPRRARRCPG